MRPPSLVVATLACSLLLTAATTSTTQPITSPDIERITWHSDGLPATIVPGPESAIAVVFGNPPLRGCRVYDWRDDTYSPHLPRPSFVGFLDEDRIVMADHDVAVLRDDVWTRVTALETYDRASGDLVRRDTLPEGGPAWFYDRSTIDNVFLLDPFGFPFDQDTVLFSTYDLITGETGKLFTLRLPDSSTFSWNGVTPDGAKAIIDKTHLTSSGAYYDSTEIIDMRTGETLLRFWNGVPRNGLGQTVFVSDQLMVVWMANSAIVIDITTGEILRRVHMPGVSAGPLAVSPDGRYIAINSDDGYISLWSLETGALLHTYTAYPTRYLGLTFTNDMQYLMSFAADGAHILWKLHLTTDVPPEITDTKLRVLPNPARDYAELAVEFPRKARAKLEIVDIHGREIETLLDEPINAGRRTILWDAREQPSGTYFCRLTLDDRTMVEPFLISH